MAYGKKENLKDDLKENGSVPASKEERSLLEGKKQKEDRLVSQLWVYKTDFFGNFYYAF